MAIELIVIFHIFSRYLDRLPNFREDIKDMESKCSPCVVSIDHKNLQLVNGSIQTTIMVAALLRNLNDLEEVANNLVIIKKLQVRKFLLFVKNKTICLFFFYRNFQVLRYTVKLSTQQFVGLQASSGGKKK